MINEAMYALGDEPSAIRELFAYGLKRKAEIGDDKVFDFSIGNPSVPAPAAVKEAILDLMEEDPVILHGYSPAAGDPQVKQVIADAISRKFGVTATPGQLYLTAGAAAGLAISIAALTQPGDEVLVISPYFPEYKTWIEAAGCTIVEVPAQVPSFQIDTEAVAAAITPKTSAVIVNSPNNPVGAVYTRENLEALATVLRAAEERFAHPIYLISDEPYREITYGAEVPYVPAIYPRTLVCYSYSKALSLPGERIGYIYVSDAMPDARNVAVAVAGAGRALGYVCAPVLCRRPSRGWWTCLPTWPPMPKTAACSPRGWRSSATSSCSRTALSTCGCARLSPMLRRSPNGPRASSFCWCPPTALAAKAGCASATAFPPTPSRVPCLPSRLSRKATKENNLAGVGPVVWRRP